MTELYHERLAELDWASEGASDEASDDAKTQALRKAAIDIINTHYPDDQKQLWLLELSELAGEEGLDSTYVDSLYEQIEGVK
jgi:hypothetical protein